MTIKLVVLCQIILRVVGLSNKPCGSKGHVNDEAPWYLQKQTNYKLHFASPQTSNENQQKTTR